MLLSHDCQHATCFVSHRENRFADLHERPVTEYPIDTRRCRHVLILSTLRPGTLKLTAFDGDARACWCRPGQQL